MTQIPDIEWCEVPAGEFIMGSDDHHDEEKLQHTLNLPYTSRWVAMVLKPMLPHLFSFG